MHVPGLQLPEQYRVGHRGRQNFRLDPYIGYGGGVAAERTASVLFVDCNFVDNAADTGGGLYLADSKATVIDTRL